MKEEILISLALISGFFGGCCSIGLCVYAFYRQYRNTINIQRLEDEKEEDLEVIYQYPQLNSSKLFKKRVFEKEREISPEESILYEENDYQTNRGI